MTYDAIVIGGGIVGMSIAYHLVKAGAHTLLFDRADPGRATDAGAGILTAETNGHAADAWLDFAATAVAYYPTLIASLQAAGAGETGYAVCGQLVVAVAGDEVEPWQQARQWMVRQQQRRGSPVAADMIEMTSEEAQALFPPLAPVRRALYYRQAARVDGRLLTQALRQAALGYGLEMLPLSVEQLIIEAGTVRGVIAGQTPFLATAVAIAGGAWSAPFAAQLGLPIPVQPVRGQIIHLRLADQETGSWPLVTAFHGHYLVAWPDSRVVIGATYEPAAGFAAQATAAGVHEVLREGIRVAPGLGEAVVQEIRVGLRPASTLDGQPLLGRVPGMDNVYLATGHGPYGLHLGPYSGKLVADWMVGGQGEPDGHLFRVSRLISGFGPVL